MSPYEFKPRELRVAFDAAGLRQALFNLPSGDWAGGDRGIACLPDRVGDFEAGVKAALRYAKALDCPAVNCLAVIPPDGVSREQAEAVLVRNLDYAAPRLADAGIKLLLEPINTRDVPGFLISTTNRAEAVFQAVESDNIHLQYDFYYMQVMQGDLIPTFRRLRTGSPMCRSPTIRFATNRAPAKSTTVAFSGCSIAPATTGMWAANTSPPETPAPVSAG